MKGSRYVFLMFQHLTTWDQLSKPAISILLRMAHDMTTTNHVRMTLATMSNEMGMSESTYKRAMSELIKLQVINRIKPNFYHVNPDVLKYGVMNTPGRPSKVTELNRYKHRKATEGA